MQTQTNSYHSIIGEYIQTACQVRKSLVNGAVEIADEGARYRVSELSRAIGVSPETSISADEKEQRVVAFMDEYVSEARAKGLALNNTIDLALLSLLILLGVESPIIAAVGRKAFDSFPSEGPQIHALIVMDAFCCYVFYELGKDPSAFVSRYRAEESTGFIRGGRRGGGTLKAKRRGGRKIRTAKYPSARRS